MFKRKVVWSEGMFVQPQHFQQQERYFEFFSHARSLSAHPYFWGFRELELDLSTLALGKVALINASGLFPDGTPFSFPEQDSVVEPLEIKSTCKNELIYLALPLRKYLSTELCFNESHSLARYIAEDTELFDSNEGAGEPAITQTAHMRAKLILQSDITDSWMKLPIGRILERSNDGKVIMDRHFIQPSINYGQNNFLYSIVNEISGLLQQRGDALAKRFMQLGQGGISEVGDFLMLNLINRWQQNFNHLRDHKILHPERIYNEFLALAGELSTFTKENRRPDTYPAYLHDDPSIGFESIANDIRRSLSMVLEQNVVPIELHERQYGIRVGIINDRVLIKKARFILAVFTELPSDIVRIKFPTQIKIGPVEKIRDLVNLHLPGVAISPMPIAPRELPYHANYNYFQLETSNNLWEQLEKSGGVALHVAGDFPGLKMEFWAIK